MPTKGTRVRSDKTPSSSVFRYLLRRSTVRAERQRIVNFRNVSSSGVAGNFFFFFSMGGMDVLEPLSDKQRSVLEAERMTRVGCQLHERSCTNDHFRATRLRLRISQRGVLLKHD